MAAPTKCIVSSMVNQAVIVMDCRGTHCASNRSHRIYTTDLIDK